MSIPAKLQFQIVPQTIEAASLSLPAPKGNRRRARVRIDDFRDRLTDLPRNKLNQWKLKPAAQELLPYLAAEKSNTDLQERVRILCVSSIDSLSVRCIHRLILSMYDDPEFKILAQTRLLEQENPEWLTPVNILEQNVPNALAEKICRELLPIHDALRILSLPSWSALAEATLNSISKYWSAEYLKSLPASETLDWIAKSSAPVAIRNRLLKALLRRYATCIPSPQWIQKGRPLGELIQIAMTLWPYPSALWNQAPPDAKKAAQWVYHDSKLRQHLSTEEFDFWSLLIQDIEDMFWLPNEQVLGISLDNTLVLQRTGEWLLLPPSKKLAWQFRQWNSESNSSPEFPWRPLPESVDSRIQTLKNWSS